MKLNISNGANVNYLAKIVCVDKFTPHPNPEYTKLKVAHIDGFNLIVSTDMTEGIYVYFPAMCQINPELLSYLSLYRNKEKNRNVEKAGFFGDNGRVKAIRLGGALSEGFIMPIKEFQNWIVDSVNVELNDVEIGTEFNEIEHNGKVFWINRKYVVKKKNKSSIKNPGAYRNNKLKRFDMLIDGQFKFHYDTVLIRREPWIIQPNDLISITSKWHGTSLIASRVLCKHPRKKWDKIITWLYKKLGGTLPRYTDVASYPEYDYIWSSRSVIKNNNINPKTGEGFYEVDVWKHGFEYLKPYLEKGMTIYAEIVGYLPNGAYIQNEYDYGCIPPEAPDDYHEGTHFKVAVYRITQTNVDGKVHEYSAREVQQFCEMHGIKAVNQFYYGTAYNLYPHIINDEDYGENFINELANDKEFFMEMNSPDCINQVPHEGIVIKKEDGIAHAWRLKTFAFMNREQKELDKGIENVEDNS